jgi:hypothetical protein
MFKKCFEPTLMEILDLSDKLSGVFAALAYEHLYAATSHMPISVAQAHPGSIAGCLRTFMYKVN